MQCFRSGHWHSILINNWLSSFFLQVWFYIGKIYLYLINYFTWWSIYSLVHSPQPDLYNRLILLEVIQKGLNSWSYTQCCSGLLVATAWANSFIAEVALSIAIIAEKYISFLLSVNLVNLPKWINTQMTQGTH